MHLADLPTPALVLDLDILERNLAGMAERTRRLGVALRPHVKTHKCVEVARRQVDAGARGLTVSTLLEARAMVDAGFDDLTWAFPLNPSRLDELPPLLERANLRLLVDTPEAIDLLEERVGPRAEHDVHVWLEVDCGDGRSGVDPESARAVELARRLDVSTRLVFDGLLTHGGHSYANPEARLRVAEEEPRPLVKLAERLRGEGIEVPGVSIGSTPTLTAARELAGVTEARPGNYAFFDATQVALGSCGVEDVAVTVVASVVSCQPGSKRSVLDTGALSLSKDPGPSWTEPGFGQLFHDLDPKGPRARTLDPERRLVSLSQEHGVVNGELPVGHKVRVLPNHSCLVVPCFAEYVVARGTEVVERWPIAR